MPIVKTNIFYYIYKTRTSELLLLSPIAPIKDDKKRWIHPDHGYTSHGSPCMFSNPDVEIDST